MQRMKQGGNNFSMLPSTLVAFLAFLSFCHAQGQQAETLGVLEVGAAAPATSQSAKLAGQQSIELDAAPLIRELVIGAQNHFPLDILRSTDPKYMVRP